MKLTLFALCLAAGVAVMNAHVTHHVNSDKHILSHGFGRDHIDTKVHTDPISGARVVERIPHTYTANQVRPIVDMYHGPGHFSSLTAGSTLLRRGGMYNGLGGGRYNRRYGRRYNRYPRRYNRFNNYNRGHDFLPGSVGHMGHMGHGHDMF